MFSGGIGSWAAAKRVAAAHGTGDMVLLFADTMMEDEDLYRFLNEASENIGVPITRIADGRNVWEVFADGHCIGNGKVDLCSSTLKRDLLDEWRNEHCEPAHAVIYVGIDWTEKHRLDRLHKACAPWQYEAPLVSPPYRTKGELLKELIAVGIAPPKLYKLGFAHNNCGGFCVKAGHSQFALLLRTMPDRYRWHEEQEERVRHIQRVHGVVPSSVLYHRRGGQGRVRITLREFRELAEREPELLEQDDLARGCGCGL